MDDMVIEEPVMKAVVQRLQVPVGYFDRPPAHGLCRDENAVVLKLLGQTIDWLGINILVVVDPCDQ